jgi:hypothetical protein
MDVYEEFSLRYLEFEFGEGDGYEWENFCVVLYSCLHEKAIMLIDDMPEAGAVSNEDADWMELLGSRVHARLSLDPAFRLFDVDIKKAETSAAKIVLQKRMAESKELNVKYHTKPGFLRRFMEPILVALHLVYEDFKLNRMLGGYCIGDLASLVTLLASELGWKGYIEYYKRDGYEAIECEPLFSGLIVRVLTI